MIQIEKKINWDREERNLAFVTSFRQLTIGSFVVYSLSGVEVFGGSGDARSAALYTALFGGRFAPPPPDPRSSASRNCLSLPS